MSKTKQRKVTPIYQGIKRLKHNISNSKSNIAHFQLLIKDGVDAIYDKSDNKEYLDFDRNHLQSLIAINQGEIIKAELKIQELNNKL